MADLYEQLTKPVDDNEHEDAGIVGPLEGASFISKLFWTWPTELIRLASERTLQFEDLWRMRPEDRCSGVATEIQGLWDAECREKPLESRSLQRVLLRWARWRVAEVLGWKTLWLIASLMGNGFVLRWLLRFIESGSGDVGTGILWVVLFGVCELLRSVSVNQHWVRAMFTGTRMRGALRVLLYDKVMRLRNPQVSVGQVVNLSSSDAQRVFEACQYGQFMISCPVSLLVIIVIMLFMIGPSSLAGFAVLFLAVPLQTKFGAWYAQLRRKTVKITDDRIRVMTEALNGIRLLKQYAWEAAIASRVSDIRARELAQLGRAAVIRAGNFVLGFAIPVVVTLATFATYSAVTGESLRPSDAFAVIALFNVSRFPLSVVGIASRNVSEASVALQRIQAFLELPEVEARDLPNGNPTVEELPLDESIRWDGASFSWSSDDRSERELLHRLATGGAKKPAKEATVAGAAAPKATDPEASAAPSASLSSLSELSVSIRKGELVALVGTVGAGKSSLLSTLTGQLRRTAGELFIRGSVSLVAQNPWVFNGTFRENIVFGSAYDEAKYHRALECSQLLYDLHEFTAGDETEIGERGVSLSGGQRARVALARAVYSDSDVVLLDGVLSAVDVHVGEKLWEQCICGELGGKTRILTTHHLAFMERCDRIIVMDGGRITACGSFAELAAAGITLAASQGAASEEGSSSPASPAAELVVAAPVKTPLSSDSIRLTLSGKAGMGKLVSKEDRAEGGVSVSTFSRYFASAGGCWWAYLLALLLILGRGSKIGSDYWVSVWTESLLPGASQGFYVGIYAATTAAVLVLNLILGVSFVYVTIRASRKLHDQVFASVMTARTSWFDATPVGRILNRFSSDLDAIDVMLPQVTQTCLELVTQCLLSVVVIAVILPWFLIPLVPLAVVFWFNLVAFRRAARDLKRIDGTTRSPLFSHLQSSVQGLSEIRAFREAQRYRRLNVRFTDANNRSFFGFYAANRWVGFKLDLITMAITVVSALIVVLSTGLIDAGLAGLVMSYALQMAGIFQFAARQMAETEALFTSVERLGYYTENTPQERVYLSEPLAGVDKLESAGSAPAVSDVKVRQEVLNLVPGWDPKSWPRELAAWPSKGRIKAVDLTVRYESSDKPVLKGVSFDLPAGCSLGIVGRTGSGKSTLLQSLFRMVDAERGYLEIDGVPLGSAPLYQLRSRLTLVPQDPTLFVGTVRSNLDPFNQYSDDACLDALSRAGLKDRIDAAEGLRSVVTEGGSNYSAGERQLMCLARALLRDARVLVLDEATSQTDSETDQRVQRVLRALKGRTVIVVAHRLETIADCDAILALEDGQVAEFGNPAELLGETLSRPVAVPKVEGVHPGLFSELVAGTGSETAAFLRKVAVSGVNEAYAKPHE
jgi:ABC-type multidrug transport system fused ATPase/permease subunit